MAKGSRGGKGGGSPKGGLNPKDIISTQDMIVERGNFTEEVDDVLTVSRDMLDMYGNSVPLEQFQIAKLKGGAVNALAYYDGANIAVNEAYLNSAKMSKAYADCVKSGFHPSNGNKTAMQAVIAHEFGHAMTDAVATKMGITSGRKLETAADSIMKQAAKNTNHKSTKSMMKKISGYAEHSHAEAIAEAFADVYCNGKKARKESHAIVDAMNSYLK